MFILKVIIEKTCFDKEFLLCTSSSKEKILNEIKTLKTNIKLYLDAINLKIEELDEKYNTSSALWFIQDKTEFEKEINIFKKDLWESTVSKNYEIFIEKEEDLETADFTIIESISLD